MKIIFLDIDGVLNCTKYYRSVDRTSKSWTRFNPVAVILIKKLIDEFSLKIVISSTWRFGAIQMLNDELRKSGLINYLHKDWKTPQLYPPNRGTEIKSWPDEHPEVIEYIILDDDDSILEKQKKSFIKTDLNRGLTVEHYNQAKRILFKTE